MITQTFKRWLGICGCASAIAVAALSIPFSPGHAQAQRPNILVIMGDDVGWFNIGAYHQGIMSGKTPNLDRLAAEGMRFTDYYAEASCTAGRANFITGELPIRTGLTTVGQAGALPECRRGTQIDGLRHGPVRATTTWVIATLVRAI